MHSQNMIQGNYLHIVSFLFLVVIFSFVCVNMYVLQLVCASPRETSSCRFPLLSLQLQSLKSRHQAQPTSCLYSLLRDAVSLCLPFQFYHKRYYRQGFVCFSVVLAKLLNLKIILLNILIQYSYKSSNRLSVISIGLRKKKSFWFIMKMAYHVCFPLIQELGVFIIQKIEPGTVFLQLHALMGMMAGTSSPFLSCIFPLSFTTRNSFMRNLLHIFYVQLPLLCVTCFPLP